MLGIHEAQQANCYLLLLASALLSWYLCFSCSLFPGHFLWVLMTLDSWPRDTYDQIVATFFLLYLIFSSRIHYQRASFICASWFGAPLRRYVIVRIISLSLIIQVIGHWLLRSALLKSGVLLGPFTWSMETTNSISTQQTHQAGVECIIRECGAGRSPQICCITLQNRPSPWTSSITTVSLATQHVERAIFFDGLASSPPLSHFASDCPSAHPPWSNSLKPLCDSCKQSPQTPAQSFFSLNSLHSLRFPIFLLLWNLSLFSMC